MAKPLKPTSCGKLQRISCEIKKNETLKFRKVVKVVISVRPQIKLQSFTLKPFKQNVVIKNFLKFLLTTFYPAYTDERNMYSLNVLKTFLVFDELSFGKHSNLYMN